MDPSAANLNCDMWTDLRSVLMISVSNRGVHCAPVVGGWNLVGLIQFTRWFVFYTLFAMDPLTGILMRAGFGVCGPP